MACKIEDTAKLELCCFDIPSVFQAARLDVPRVEYCVDYAAGGLWPGSQNLIEARSIYSGCLSVMVRPRPGNFIYRDEEWILMYEQISEALHLGADGITLGAIRSDGTFPLDELQALLGLLPSGISLTFHRAFDLFNHHEEVLQILVSLGFNRVLSSGGVSRAVDRAEWLGQCQSMVGDALDVVAAGGVKASHIDVLRGHGVSAFHASASSSPDGTTDPILADQLLSAWKKDQPL